MNVLSYTEVQLGKEILHPTFKEKKYINSVIPSMEIGNRRKKGKKKQKQASFLPFK